MCIITTKACTLWYYTRIVFSDKNEEVNISRIVHQNQPHSQ